MPDLHTDLSQLGADLLLDTVQNLNQSLLNAQPQDESKASYGINILTP